MYINHSEENLPESSSLPTLRGDDPQIIFLNKYKCKCASRELYGKDRSFFFLEEELKKIVNFLARLKFRIDSRIEPL